MKVHMYERVFLTVGAIMLVAFLGALLYASVAMGIHLPGPVGKVDPTMVTAAMTTMVLVYPWLSRLTSSGESRFPDSRAAERAYTAFWLDVLAPRPGMRESEPGPIGSGFGR